MTSSRIIRQSIKPAFFFELFAFLKNVYRDVVRILVTSEVALSNNTKTVPAFAFHMIHCAIFSRVHVTSRENSLRKSNVLMC